MKLAKRFFLLLFTAIIPCFAQHYEIFPTDKQLGLTSVEEALAFMDYLEKLLENEELIENLTQEELKHLNEVLIRLARLGCAEEDKEQLEKDIEELLKEQPETFYDDGNRLS